MVRTQQIYNLFSVLITFIFIVPFIYITRFAHLAADDYCRANTELGKYGVNIYEWYLHHNGRFTNAFLSFLPVYNSGVYKLVLMFSFILLGLAILFFVKNVFNHFNFVEDWSEVYFITALFYIGIIICLPSPYEFFYWYAGTSAYMYSIILFLFLTGLLFRSNRENSKNILLAGLLIVLIIGNNEMLIPIINFLLLTLLIITLMGDKLKLKFKILILNLLGWISSLIVIFSPGSTKRQGLYSEAGDILFSINSAILSSGMFTLKKLFEFPNVILYIGLTLVFLQLKSKEGAKSLIFNPIHLAVVSFISLGLIFFVPFYATSHLNVNSGRIGNMIQVVFWIILVINLINLSSYAKGKFFKKIFVPAYLPMGIIIVFVIFAAFSNKNYQGLISDFKNDEFQRFEKLMTDRENKIKNAKGPYLEIQEISGTQIMKHYGISTDRNYWVNRCFTNAMNFMYDKEFEQIISDKQ